MSAHSAAPWAIRELTCEDHRGMGWVEDANGNDIACCGAKELWQEENRANAHLIAAAPDLLAASEQYLNALIALNEAVKYGDSEDANDDEYIELNATAELAYRDLRAAIAKARGQS